jgi:hypothetical protein
MAHVVHDVAFRARASGNRPSRGQKVRPSGFLVVTILNLVLWSALIALIVRAI